jgi:hypothetical protein
VPKIDLGYNPREQFVGFHKRTERWGCIVAHRRAGKTVASIADLIDACLRSDKRNPRFAYVAPTYTQAKDIAWNYLKSYSGIPGVAYNESELRVDYPNQGRIRLYGAENYDRMRGLYFDGVIIDEPADMDPRAWSEVIRPALSDRQGWAVFIGTPKGHNSFWSIFKRSKDDDTWFSLELRASKTGIIPKLELIDAQQSMTPEQYQQEYECSFEAAIRGAYYADLMRQADEDGRIAGVPYDPCQRVWTSWDLGMRDKTAIWFAQIVGREVHLIDYYEASGADLAHYVKVLDGKRYSYAGHILPHDAQARELGTGKTRQEVLESLGLDVTIAINHRIPDGINAVRVMLPRCYFDAVKCERGIEALRIYRQDYDEKLQSLRKLPLHDWSSHPADSLRYLAVSIEDMTEPLHAMPSQRRYEEGAWMG